MKAKDFVPEEGMENEPENIDAKRVTKQGLVMWSMLVPKVFDATVSNYLKDSQYVSRSDFIRTVLREHMMKDNGKNRY